MKRVAFLITVILIAGGAAALAQESPAEVVQRQADEERARRITGKIADLEVTAQSLQEQIDKLNATLGKLREDIARAASHNQTAALEERLRSLAADITEVDKKRMADNEKITAYIEREFSRLAKALSVTPSAKPPAGAGPSGTPAGKSGTSSKGPPVSSDTQKMLKYKIQSGDTLSSLLGKLRKENIKVTQKQVEEANPTIKDWKRLQIDQEIFIPAPAQ